MKKKEEKVNDLKIEVLRKTVINKMKQINLNFPKVNFLRKENNSGTDSNVEKNYFKILKDYEDKSFKAINSFIKNYEETISKDFTNTILVFLAENQKKLKEPKYLDQFRRNLFDNMNCSDFEIIIEYFIFKWLNYGNLFGKNIYDLSKDKTEENFAGEIIDELIQALFIAFRTRKDTELDLTQCMITDVSNLGLALCINSNIKSVILTINQIDLHLFYFSRSLLHNKQLMDLDLSFNPINDHSLNLLISCLKHETETLSFRRLNISNLQLTKESGQTIGQILLASPNLKYLNLNRSKIADGFIHIANSLLVIQQKRKSELLVLLACSSDNDSIDSSSLHQMGLVVRDNFCTIESLILSFNNLNNIGGKYLIDSLLLNKSIKEIILNKCNLSSKYGIEKAITKLIFNSITLMKVDLFNNALSNQDLMMKNILSLRNSKNEFKDSEKMKIFDYVSNEQQRKNYESKIKTQEYTKKYKHQMQSYDHSKNMLEYIITNVLVDLVSEDLDLKILDLTQNKRNGNGNSPTEIESMFMNNIIAKEKIIKVIF